MPTDQASDGDDRTDDQARPDGDAADGNPRRDAVLDAASTTPIDLHRSYPGGADDRQETDGDQSQDSADGCGSCPTGSDAGALRPSIYQPFWRDARARMARRDYAKLIATVGGLTALASLVAPVSGLTQVFDRKYRGPVYSDGVALVDENGERISEGQLSVGDHMTVFPEPRPGIDDAPTLLVRFEEDAYGDQVEDAFTVAGYAAFSKVCTHAGCMVSDRDGDVLVCPCHSGRFDPFTGAGVVGGPPPRPLPQLPITISSDGFLVATGDFQGHVGPGGE